MRWLELVQPVSQITNLLQTVVRWNIIRWSGHILCGICGKLAEIEKFHQGELQSDRVPVEIMAVTFVGEFVARKKEPLEIEILSPMDSIK